MSIETCDVVFPLEGEALPLDHGYPLFGAIARLVPAIHREPRWGIHPVRGEAQPRGPLRLTDRATLSIRVPNAAIGQLMPLAGARLEVDGHHVQLGAPRVWPLRPTAALQARLVVVASVVDVDADEAQQRQQMLDSMRRKLARMPLEMDAERIEVTIGRRHVLRIGGARERQRRAGAVVDRDIIVGFQVALTGLEATASLVVQSEGLGGRRHMGCGLFVPAPRVIAP
jgi:CRISPR-associated protein Cas6